MRKSLSILLMSIIFLSGIILAQDGRPQYKISNERAGVYIGDIIIELFPYVAPLHVANFDSLVSISFYDSTAWHRVVPNFVIQGGDPNSKHGPRNTWGEGDSTQATVPAEFSKVSHLKGILGAARDTDINSATSQFYINTVNNTGLDGRYTAYGIVIGGMDVVHDIENSPRDGNDNPHEKIEMFITKIGINESIPDVPQLIAPADGFVGFQSNTDLVWGKVEEAVLTFLEVAHDSNFSNLAYADSFAVTTGNTSIKYPGVEFGQVKYFWRVRSNNGAKFSDYSETRGFTSSIQAPTLIAPENTATNISTSPLLEWNPVEGAVSYRLQIAHTLPSFTESRIVFDESGITEPQKQIENLAADTRHYWRVLGEAEEYDGPYSNTWLFTTEQATSVNDDSPKPDDFFLFQNYPNPFNPESIIKIQIAERTNTVLKIFDITGREVQTLLNESIEPGVYEINFDASDLTSGIYYYRLETDSYNQTRKMILLK
ncbi:hypothetical protein ASZ90_004230 [hydrocarbon metagenome]|uniref:peptidylprolyl isomerase n=1 Tax=hydrocarbon metagenome TaxID=938273 RepID=A0A0W8G0D1_9ZZZZ